MVHCHVRMSDTKVDGNCSLACGTCFFEGGDNGTPLEQMGSAGVIDTAHFIGNWWQQRESIRRSTGRSKLPPQSHGAPSHVAVSNSTLSDRRGSSFLRYLFFSLWMHGTEEAYQICCQLSAIRRSVWICLLGTLYVVFALPVYFCFNNVTIASWLWSYIAVEILIFAFRNVTLLQAALTTPPRTVSKRTW